MSAPSLPRGPVMADVEGLALTPEEKKRLLDPAIGGIILFRRNFENIDQLKNLIREIKALRQPELIIAVDHEGGRVQRFIPGFTRLPAMSVLGEVWDTQGEAAAKHYAEQVGWVLAAELSACGIDLSFAPVLDLDWGKSAVIGNRSFHRNAEIVSELALALQRGLNRGGMKSCGKHFPGHGFAEGDSHLDRPSDKRTLAELAAEDMLPFQRLSDAGMAAVMPAHVVYPQIDSRPAGFSAVWLKDILRKQIGFQGVIFTDDLTMEGACAAGGICERADSAFAAGCDIALVCNRPDLVDELRAAFKMPDNPDLARRWQYMANTLGQAAAEKMLQQTDFQAAQALTAALASPKDTAGGVQVGEAF
ncbi:beta-N-acetylhexosaminidase [Neisseria sp. ZJ106]|uniref:Beta-hexosaminidase n=1 Tax=Neisseria lisongii TaxID=2912188 RepID=A0ABY7RKK2_9NEIS|nr:beta-N-acetylhexosaminidase [Neisseria lisongii]MCF7521264.1 beta-N-acetylhexosaminidase [Neisseria lisongii]WCL71756.1 beta-N-acetylhexosaminidase [Neisseria lisongii]